MQTTYLKRFKSTLLHIVYQILHYLATIYLSGALIQALLFIFHNTKLLTDFLLYTRLFHTFVPLFLHSHCLEIPFESFKFNLQKSVQASACLERISQFSPITSKLNISSLVSEALWALHLSIFSLTTS